MEHTSASQVVAENVKTLLEQAGLSQTNFAAGVGWSDARVSRRLNGSRWWAEEIEEAARFLNVQPEVLTRREVAA